MKRRPSSSAPADPGPDPETAAHAERVLRALTAFPAVSFEETDEAQLHLMIDTESRYHAEVVGGKDPVLVSRLTRALAGLGPQVDLVGTIVLAIRHSGGDLEMFTQTMEMASRVEESES